MSLSRETLLLSTKRRYITVETPLGPARLQSLTHGEWRAVQNLVLTAEEGDRRWASMLLAKSLVDDAGDRLFSDQDARDGALDDSDSQVVSILAAAAESLNGVPDQSRREIETAVKNSRNGQAISSGSASPSLLESA